MKKIVVIGGGFTGAYCAKKLENRFDVTLIDNKDYFEFTPGVLRTIVEPEHAARIETRHKDYLKKARIMNGQVVHVGKNEIELGNKEKLEFDYLIIATGSRYSSPIKEEEIILADRGKRLKENYEKLCKAKKILIVGGGLVGVELAAEIVEKYDNKEVILVHSHQRLMERQPQRASRYAEKFLKKRNVRLMLDETVVKYGKKVFETNKNNKIEADLVFLCTGITPNYEMLARCLKDSLDDKKFAKVNNNLQLANHNNIFAGGDIANINEEKTAQNAEKQAAVIVNNILNMEHGERLKEYRKKNRIMVISLGKYNGIITYKDFILTGIFPGIMKQIIEWKTMIRYKR